MTSWQTLFWVTVGIVGMVRSFKFWRWPSCSQSLRNWIWSVSIGKINGKTTFGLESFTVWRRQRYWLSNHVVWRRKRHNRWKRCYWIEWFRFVQLLVKTIVSIIQWVQCFDTMVTKVSYSGSNVLIQWWPNVLTCSQWLGSLVKSLIRIEMNLRRRIYKRTLSATMSPVQMNNGPAIQNRFNGLYCDVSSLRTRYVNPDPDKKRRTANER